MIKKTLFSLFILTSLVSCTKPVNDFTLTSPDKKVEVKLSVTDSVFSYQVKYLEQEVLGSSCLGIISNSNLTVLSTKETEHDDEWNPVWGQFSTIRNHYKQLEIAFTSNDVKGRLLARIFDEAVAFRFILDENQTSQNVEFLCSYAVKDGSQFYAPRGENEPIGPVSLTGLSKSQIGRANKKKAISVPLVVETPNMGFMALLESDLYAAAGFQSMRLDVNMDKKNVESRQTAILTKDELVTPWRVILLGQTAGDLVVNTATVNLATPCQIENPDWIKPGKTLWDWRVHGYTAPDGFVYGINTESYKRFIDFAADNDVDYFLIDDAWYTHATLGHFELSDKLNLNEVIAYAAEKEVELILYYDRKHGQYGDDALFPYYQSLGMKGIKYGFMGTNPKFSREAIQKSAKSKLLIDFHDSPVPFTGMRRTYPNAITREYCHAQQDSRKAFTPESFLKMALINAVTGPLDMNNGNFDLIGINNGSREKGPKKPNSYLSTVVSEAARTLVIFSGLVCIPDAPEAYKAKMDLFEFIQKQAVGQWDESRILNSKMGEYITTARRHGKEWFVGSVINQQGGTLEIDLNFLEENQEYDITFYEDTKDTHCQANPEAYQVRRSTVKRGDVINALLAPGGGHCMWIRPVAKQLLTK